MKNFFRCDQASVKQSGESKISQNMKLKEAKTSKINFETEVKVEYIFFMHLKSDLKTVSRVKSFFVLP
jgi:hypothetical protein